MTAHLLPAEAARVLTEKAGVRCTVIRKTLALHEKSGRPTSCFLRIEGAVHRDLPTGMVFAVTFSHGYPHERDNGWGGLACVQIADQKELNLARKIVADTIAGLRAIHGEWIEL